MSPASILHLMKKGYNNNNNTLCKLAQPNSWLTMAVAKKVLAFPKARPIPNVEST
jgi:hypothetical protein